ncbi:MAG: VOC family protein [Myxococcota bacterium]|nr:VOC family protein [Myxococcota bacterium]
MQRVVPVLAVSDFERSRRFYGDSLDFEIDWEWRDAPDEPVFAQISRAGLSLYLSAREDDGRPGTTRAYLYVSDVDAWYDELLEAGLDDVSRPADRPWGNRELTLRDPDGNTLVLATVRINREPR